MTDFNLVLSQVRQRLEILYQIVDELEAQGGGGGTTDYTDLDNKPKINNVTLSGNKTGSDLGLASTSDITAAVNALDVAEVGGSTYFLTTISETNGKISATAVAQSTVLSDYLTTSEAASTYQTQSGMSNYYTKTETEGEIVGAINDLDVSAVGGSTKYITTISEANGLIDATAASPDTVPTLDSAKLITSGGVKDYVDTGLADKVGLADIFGQGTRIQGTSEVHANLDDYFLAGNYHILTAGDARNVDNKPYDSTFDIASVRARVMVFQLSGTTTTNARCFQIYVPARTNDSTGTNVMYIRYRYISSDVGAWTAWYAIAGTALSPAPALNMVNEMRTAVEPDEDEGDER